MRKIVFATNNAHKLEEVRAIVKDQLEILSLEDIGCHDTIAETGDTLEANALIKARHIHAKYGYDCFGDDTGLEVIALNGSPGVYSARYAGEENNAHANMDKLLHKLADIKNRKAQFRTVIALIVDGKEYLFEGKIDGIILTEKKGDTGFGYDPIFQPDGYTKSFAELGSDTKNDISHRALASQRLCAFLNKI